MGVKLFMASVLVASTLLFGCSSSSDSVCDRDGDCESGQVCEDGACTTPSQIQCSGDPDCTAGHSCVDGTCRPLNVADMGNTNPNNNNNTTPDMSVDLPPDAAADNVNPEVLTITPANGTTDVAKDVEVKVTFNEALNPLTVNFQSLLLKSPSGADVATIVTYDEATKTATIKPNAALFAASGYRVVPTALLRDEAGNALRIDPSPDVRFYTGVAEPADHTTLAQTFAPVIYQSIEIPSGRNINTDMPTNIDFDGNWKARDNKAASLNANTRTKAHVYYSVVESKTHYFITYALYYPIRRDKNLQENYEHDFTGMVAVVDKATQSLKLVEGVKVDDGADTALGFKPASSDVADTGQPQNIWTFVDGDLEEKHFPLFIPSGIHEGCHWKVEGPTLPAVCRHNSGEFSEGPTAGVVMRHGTAQAYSEAVMADSQLTMTYELRPLATLWARRSDVHNEGLWETISAYDPIDDRAKKYPGTEEPVIWPNRLVTDDANSFGKPPFAWLKLSGKSNQGQWLFDPAYLLTVRYNFGTSFSNEYCYNLFLGINDRSTAECQAAQ